MRGSWRILLAAGTTGVLLAAGGASAADTQVVVQVSDADQGKWNLALNNARNLQADLGKENVDVEIVVYGPGIGMLKADSLVANRIQDATAAGVKVVACQNTLTAQKLDKDDMIAGIDYVPAGVVEIAQRQKQGWAYLRP
jgi:hypothetical protein